MSMLVERRAVPRFTVALGVVLSPGGPHYFMETENVSEIGLCLLSKRALPVGSQLRMIFGRPPHLGRLGAIGTVRWSESGRGAGIEFTSISPNDQQALRQFLSSGKRPRTADAPAVSGKGAAELDAPSPHKDPQIFLAGCGGPEEFIR